MTIIPSEPEHQQRDCWFVTRTCLKILATLKELSASLALRGVTVSSADLWIGSTALVHGLTLVTHKLKDFRKNPGLDLETWP
ncbi:MAG TPA: hypothetical protein PKO06_11010 [Candidatus Ozemobacteraceae bacterium]|nr:hypothetical protein [Candidatus Ozemobacteraceae bacterium]